MIFVRRRLHAEQIGEQLEHLFIRAESADDCVLGLPVVGVRMI
jgi:hypothetical protein